MGSSARKNSISHTTSRGMPAAPRPRTVDRMSKSRVRHRPETSTPPRATSSRTRATEYARLHWCVAAGDMYLRFEGVVSDRSSKLGTKLLAVPVPKLGAAPKLLAVPVARIPTSARGGTAVCCRSRPNGGFSSLNSSFAAGHPGHLAHN
eukprot:scaffold18342_cov63-Phaeocystis_antarctica.AAC.2